jgi:cysteine-rich repeat protein
LATRSSDDGVTTDLDLADRIAVLGHGPRNFAAVGWATAVFAMMFGAVIAGVPRAHEQVAAIDELEVRPLCVTHHCEAPPSEPAEAQPECGNGTVEADEECDDGNLRSLDGCDLSCHVEPHCCCGNGAVDPGEDCDDGNDIDGDGCSPSCKIDSY